VQERVRWYCPGFLEIRSFKNKPGISYELGQKYKVFPQGISWRIYKHFPIYKHYPFRSANQIMKKKRSHQDTGFNKTYERFNGPDNCFMDILPGYKVARKYDGGFHEFEIKNQGSLLGRWLRSRKYITW
jgi:hypothetical protein